MECRTDSLAAVSISATLIASGFLLLSAWPQSDALGKLWLAISVIALFITTQASIRFQAVRLSSRYLSFPWLWLVLALLSGMGVLFVGHEEYGAMRHYGDALKIRSGLWAVQLHTVFIAILSQRACAGTAVHFVAIAGTGLLALALLAQPDYFSVLMLAAACLLVAVQARNGLRIWLGVSVGGCALLLGGAILSSPHRLQRLLAHFDNFKTDSFGIGFEARMIAKATEQAGWFGFQGDLSASAMARLPSSLEWYSLSYLGLWLGNGVVLLVLVLLFALAFLIYRQSCQIDSDTQRLIVQGGLLIFVLNLLWAIAGTFAVIVPNGHYGLPFLSAGQMSLVAILLLFAAHCGSPETTGNATSE